MPKVNQPHRTHSAGRSSAQYVVFLSHSSHDNWIAGVMAEKIRAVKAETWLDEKDLEGGDILVEKIIQGIDACAEAIVLVTPHSAQSQWVAFEIGAVRAQHKRITPILYGVSPESVVTMKDVKAIELDSFNEFLSQLKKRVAAK